MDEREFLSLLQSVLKPDTAGILDATNTLKSKYFTDPAALPFLLRLVGQHPDTQLRQLAAVEARTLVPKLWAKQTPELQAHMRAEVLTTIANQDNSLVKHSLARVIAAIAKADADDHEWTDLLTYLGKGAHSSSVHDREISTYIIYTLLDAFEERLSDKWPDFFVLFARTLDDQESLKVRMNTVLALGKIADAANSEDKETQAAFVQLFPKMVLILREAVNLNDEEMVSQAFNVFQNLLLDESAYIGPHFRDLINFMLELAAAKDNVDDDSRCKALNFLMSCVQYKKHKVQSAKLGETLTLRALDIGSEGRSTDEDADDEESTQPWTLALSLIDFLAANLPPSQVAVPLLNILPKYSTSSDPNARIAAVMALGYVSEGAPDFMASQIHAVFPTVLSMLADPEQRVRYAALQSLSRMADDLEEELGKEHARAVPALLRLIVESQELAHNQTSSDTLVAACNALGAFLPNVDEEPMEAYLPQIMPPLTSVFDRAADDLKLKASVVSAIGSTAAASGSVFLAYLDKTVEAFGPFLSIKDSEEELDLRAVTYDSLGEIAQAVDGPPFAKYVTVIMESCREALHLENARLNESCFIFFSTCSKVYQDEFNPFMDWVVPALFKSLEQEEKEEIAGLEVGAQELVVGATGSKGVSIKNLEIVGPDEEDDEWDDDEEADWNDIFAVTPVAMEKEIAVDVLGDILSNSKRSFMPYMEKAVATLVEKASHTYEGVRKAAISSLWRAYCVVWQLSEPDMPKWQPGWPLKVKPTPELEQLAHVVITCTLVVWKAEQDSDVVKVINDNLAEALKITGPAMLSDPNGAAVKIVIEELEDVLQKQHPAQLSLGLGDDDEDDDEEESSEMDWQVIESAMNLTAGLATAMGEQFPEIWGTLAPLIIKYYGSLEARERAAAVGATGEVIGAMGKAVTPFSEQLMTLVSRRLGDPDKRTKSNAAYAIGLLCAGSENAAVITRSYPAILEKLQPILESPPTQEADPDNLIDNVCGCAARMVVAHPESVDLDSMLPSIVSHLPLINDYDENEPVYEMILKLYDAKVGLVQQLTPQVLKGVAHVMESQEEQVSDELKEKLVSLVKYIQQQSPASLQSFPILAQLAGSAAGKSLVQLLGQTDDLNDRYVIGMLFVHDANEGT